MISYVESHLRQQTLPKPLSYPKIITHRTTTYPTYHRQWYGGSEGFALHIADIIINHILFLLLQIHKEITKTLNYEVKGKPKVVIYWLAKLKNTEQEVKLSDEHQDLKWLGLHEAQELSGFNDMKQLLAEFHEKAMKLT